ncbi:ribonuclease E/G, partial [Salmonella enterica subsp. enterica serovar Cerro]|nr:ribonuclease E/G [Salmonella enterica subsp. enterica serovar Cerro]
RLRSSISIRGGSYPDIRYATASSKAASTAFQDDPIPAEGAHPFDLYDVENEIQRALERKVELKSGGYLIIDQTEAMTTVDINTG